MTATTPTTEYSVEKIRSDFPILQQTVHGKPLIYLDNANTTQKPAAVLESLANFYSTSNSNIHRASHMLGERATQAYEGAREKVREFIHAASTQEVVFVRNATEGVNLVAQTWGRTHIGKGDEILVSAMEHHANIVPWQMLCQEKEAILRVIPVDDQGELVLDALDELLTPRTRLVGIVHMSNVLGTVNPVQHIIQRAHAYSIPVLVDAAQSAYHMPIDVQQMDCDFLVFSGHKLYGPTGIGVLYGKKALLQDMPPWQGGGDMILSVSFEKTVYNDLPYRFEAGTPHIAGAVGLGAAIDWLQKTGMSRIADYERTLMQYGTKLLAQVDGLRMIGVSPSKASVFSFTLEGVHPHDVGTMLDYEGIAIRTGQHCAHPLMQRFQVPATVRASLACYNTHQELDALAESLKSIRTMFA